MSKKKRQEERKQQIEEKLALQNTFQSIAREWIENQRSGWSHNHAEAVKTTLQADAIPKIGDLPIDSISPPMVLDIIRTIEDRGAQEMAKKVLQRITAVFRYAIQTGRATHNPASEMKERSSPEKCSTGQHFPLKNYRNFFMNSTMATFT